MIIEPFASLCQSHDMWQPTNSQSQHVWHSLAICGNRQADRQLFEKSKDTQAFCPLRVHRRKASSLRSRTQGPGLAPTATKALPVQVFKKKIRMERQQRMADANRPHPIAHDTSDATTMIILTPDQRAR